MDLLRDLRVSREGLSLPDIHKAVLKCMSIRRFISPPFLLAMAVFLCTIFANSVAGAQTGYTWQQVKDKFEAANPALRAYAIGIDEAKAE